jgi:hypothetical protein
VASNHEPAQSFPQSPHHAALALATLGIGFASGEPLFLIAGFVAYVLGWVYVPDLAFFQRWLEARAGAAENTAAGEELAQFVARRTKLLGSLTPSRRARYQALAAVCRDIEEAAADGDDDPRVRRLEELMWTFLRLLSIEESLGEFLETEASENVPALATEAAVEVARLETEVSAAKGQGTTSAAEARERLLISRRERLEALRKRAERIEQARGNLALVVAEQERLEQQIKLIRADSIATKNATALTARIDATVEHLEQTNHWLAQMDEFKDLVSDVPQTQLRVGFGDPATPPELPRSSGSPRKGARVKVPSGIAHEFRGAHSSRVLAKGVPPSRTSLDSTQQKRLASAESSKVRFRGTRKPALGTSALPRVRRHGPSFDHDLPREKTASAGICTTP